MLARTALYLGLATFLSGKYYFSKFDDKLSIAQEVRRDPKQESISASPFPFEYRGKRYQITPVANYDISGLIVSHNEISSITDAYHTSDSVDFRDVCVVWGANVGSGVFRRFKFWSEPWSCHFHTDDPLAAASLNKAQVSNNHLLTDNEQVRELIKDMRIGDQIRLQGMLINYSPAGQPELSRRSSRIREDTGNGACEVIWVDHAQVLQRGATSWHILREGGFWLLIGAITLNALLFVFAPYGAMSRRRLMW